MRVLRRSRWLARLAGCAVLTTGIAAVAAGASAPARAGIVFQSHVVASWGDNRDGDLGDGTTTIRSLYGDIRLANDVVQVAAGYYFGLALRGDGTVWAWGDNGAGSLGDGTTTDRSSPGRVLGPDGVVTQVAAGSMSLALLSDGTVWEWGDHWLIPVPVPGLTGITKISAGSTFNLALRSDSTVWAWGNNDHGQLGNGTTVTTLTPVMVTGLSHVTGIAAGYNAAVATATNGISALTSVWTWGANDHGQLGDGTLADHLLPERVTGIGTNYIAGVTAGLWTGAVLGTDGSVWGWGDNSAGQLVRTPSSSPATRPVSMFAAGSGITQLSAGWGHMLALKSNGTVLAWGSNQVGQLGNGSRDPATGPVQVTGLTAATQVAACGRGFSLAVHTVPYLLGS
jgi:alpha-tubulin suppressor-like RCC1 family protein